MHFTETESFTHVIVLPLSTTIFVLAFHAIVSDGEDFPSKLRMSETPV